MSEWLTVLGLTGGGFASAVAIHTVGRRFAPHGAPWLAPSRPSIIVLIVLACLAPLVAAWGAGLQSAPSLTLFVWGGMAAGYWDLTRLRIPRLFSLGFAAIGLCAALLTAPDRFPAVVMGAVFAFVLLSAARHAFQRQRGVSGLGGGDPALFAALAAWLGPIPAIWALGLGSALTLMISAVRGNRDSHSAPLALGLILASWLIVAARVFIEADPLWAWEAWR